MSCTEQTRDRLEAWLESPRARDAARAIGTSGRDAAVVSTWLHTVSEMPSSAGALMVLVRDVRRRNAIPDTDVDIERWLLIRQALDLVRGSMPNLGDEARRLTCEEIATLADDNAVVERMLPASGIRFRELAKVVTGRRFCAGLFHWDECGLRRSWLAKVDPRDWVRFGRLLLTVGGLGPDGLSAPESATGIQAARGAGISTSYRAIAESLERRPDLLGFFAASWLWSPDTHRVSPHLKALSQPITENDGIVTGVGRAPLDCGVFDCSATRRRLHQEGRFTPTIGLIVWPRDAMLRWWRETSSVIPARGPQAAAV
jgi:hypothetical protein